MADAGGWKRPAGLLSVIVSAALLVALYRSIDVRQVASTLLGANRLWLLLSVALIVPINVLRAVRFFWVAPAGALPGMGEAVRLTFVAAALNVFAPAKSGDLIKSYSIATSGRTSPGVSVAIVVYERLCDLFALILWCLIGWFVGRPEVRGMPVLFWWALAAVGAVSGILVSSLTAAAGVRWFASAALSHRRLRRLRELSNGWPDLLDLLRGRRPWIVLFSIALWLAHLVQIWLFAVVLKIPVPFTVCASVSAIALMAGQLPFTFAGIGTRDVALVALLAAYVEPEAAAAMGVLIATRGLLPPVVGLPMMRPYLSSLLDDARRWQQGTQSTT